MAEEKHVHIHIHDHTSKKSNEEFHYIMLLDRSGSMASIRDDAIGGVNTFIEEQKKEPDNAFFSMIQFDDKYGDPQFWRKPINEVEPLTMKTFVPRGMTALNDAIGKTVAKVREMRASGEITGKVQFIIQTDGMENCSQEYTSPTAVSGLVKQVEEEGWGNFIFLGANIDSFATAGGFGLSAAGTTNYAATGQGIRSAHLFASTQAKSFRYGTQCDSAVMDSMKESVARGEDVSGLYEELDKTHQRSGESSEI